MKIALNPLILFSKAAYLFRKHMPPVGTNRSKWKSVVDLPGMVSLGEKRLLYSYAFSTTGPIVEFGVFFGASSGALALGSKSRLGDNSTGDKVIIYDAFSIPVQHTFSRHVIERASKYNLSQYLDEFDGFLHWERLARVILEPFKSTICFNKVVIADGVSFQNLPSNIGLLHLDMPKDLGTLRPIWNEAFPRLSQGSVVMFQDYYYHYSGDMIAFFTYLCSKDYLRLERSEACTAVFRVQEKIDVTLLNTFRQSPENIVRYLDQAVNQGISSRITSHQKTSLLMALCEAKCRYYSALQNPTLLSSLQGEIEKIITVSYRTNCDLSSRYLSQILTEKVVALQDDK
jgi:hypothetical protein